MPLRIPVSFQAEYRGQAKAGEFSDQSTGELVQFGPKLKFEYEDADGDVSIVPVSSSQLDRCEPPFDWSTLSKGDVVRLEGFVTLQDRGSNRDSFMGLTSCVPVKGRAAVAA